MKAEYIFNLYMMAPPRKEPIDVTQNDNLMVELVAKLKNRNGTAFLPPEGAVANFIAVKPDGHGIVLRSDDPEEPKVTLADDEVRVSLPREALAVTGWIACKIAIQDNDAIASAQEFSLMCNRDLLPEDFTESEAYQSIIYYLQHLGEREAEFDDMKEQFYQAINGLTEDDEVINARIDGPYATTFDTLKLRLDHMSGLLKGVVDGDFESRVSALEEEVETARGEFDALVDRLDDTDGRIADNAGEIDSAKVKILQLEQENKQLKKIVEDSNPTQSPRVSSVGYGVVSLPKNAANGQVNVSVKGLTVTNLLEDGEVLRVLPPRPGAGSSPVFFDNLNLPQDKYLIFYELVQTVETYGINSPYYNITSLDYIDPGQKTKNNTVGRKVWKLDAPETITKIGWWVYETESEVKVKNFMVVKATEEDWLLSEEKLIQKYNWHNGIKSTVSAMRVKSVSADETETSTAYVVAKDEEGKIAELRSLPNGTKDEISVSGGKAEWVKRVSDNVVLNGSENWLLQSINEHGVANFQLSQTPIYLPNIKPGAGSVSLFPTRFPEQTTFIADTTTEGFFLNNSPVFFIRIFASTLDTPDVAGFVSYLSQNPITLNYQLAEPIEIPVQVSGTLASYPNGTVYIEPFVADAGIYTDKMEVLYSDLPIKALEKISKVDFDTGLETELDITAAVIAEDKLSFTHPDLEAGDIVFFVYEYDRESTTAEAEIEYYDSRYVIKDSVTGKFYKWHIAVAEGVPSIELVEV